MMLVVMLQGMVFDVGKSVLVVGLCCIFYQDGLCIVLFKLQNMVLNFGIMLDGKEMGWVQIFQVEVVGIVLDVCMNLILFKFISDCQVQVVLMGQVVISMDVVSYYQYKLCLCEQIFVVYQSLVGEYEVLVLEGVGSLVEINLCDCDIVNMGMVEMV